VGEWESERSSSPALPLSRSLFGQLGQAEVQHFDQAVAPHHDVLRLDVPVRDPGLVRGGERGGDLDGKLNRIRRLHPLLRRACHSLAQRLAVNELLDDVAAAFNFADVVNGDDVRMVQGGGRPRLLFKAPHPLPVVRELSGQQFDGHFATQPGVEREMNFAHPATAQRRQNLVSADLAPGARLCFDRAQVFGFKLPRLHHQRVLFDEAFSLRLKAEEGFDFPPHLVIAGAGLLQISFTLSRFKLLNGAIMLADFLIAFRCHKSIARRAESFDHIHLTPAPPNWGYPRITVTARPDGVVALSVVVRSLIGADAPR